MLYWQFIQGMLSNHSSLALDKIHTFLGLFVEGGVTVNEQGLKKLLSSKVDAGLLVLTQGEYGLPVE